MTGVVVELAGPAGSGKTTLARTLLATTPRTALAGSPARGRLLRGIAPAVPVLAAARFSGPGRWWTREELRTLGHLTAWRSEVARRDGATHVLFDHGPAFRLARLAADGPPMASSPAFQRLWLGLAHDWSRLLGLVVWLDAPDDVLLARIESRAQAHRVRGRQPAVAHAFLDGYRNAYTRTLRVLEDDGVRVVRFDTSTCGEQELAARVADELGAACAP